MESVKDLILYSTNKINILCATMYALVVGYRSPYVLNLSNSNIDLSSNNLLNDTIILQGTLTANVIVIVSNTIRTYKIVNLCTGAYYVTIKTAAGTGVYSAPGDVWDVYCDGTNIKPIALLSSTREIVLPTITFAMGEVVAQVPLSAVTPTSDALAEIGSNVFTTKNKGKYQIRAYAYPTAALTSLLVAIFKNGTQLYAGGRGTVNTAWSEIRSSISSVVHLNAGETLSLSITASEADAAMRVFQICITQIS